MPPVGFEPPIAAGERPAAAHLLRGLILYRDVFSATYFEYVDRVVQAYFLLV
jgi:hypothetical protein